MSYWRGWKPGDPFKPERMDTVEFTCHNCGRWNRVPAKRVADAEAEYWRNKYERMMAQMNEIVKRCHLLHGEDPMHKWFRDALIELREQLGMWDEGDEWKGGGKS